MFGAGITTTSATTPRTKTLPEQETTHTTCAFQDSIMMPRAASSTTGCVIMHRPLAAIMKATQLAYGVELIHTRTQPQILFALSILQVSIFGLKVRHQTTKEVLDNIRKSA